MAANESDKTVITIIMIVCCRRESEEWRFCQNSQFLREFQFTRSGLPYSPMARRNTMTSNSNIKKDDEGRRFDTTWLGRHLNDFCEDDKESFSSWHYSQQRTINHQQKQGRTISRAKRQDENDSSPLPLSCKDRADGEIDNSLHLEPRRIARAKISKFPFYFLRPNLARARLLFFFLDVHLRRKRERERKNTK